MADLWTEREPGKAWALAAATVVAGGIAALCAPGWFGAAALTAALLGAGYIAFDTLHDGDPVTGVISVVAYLGVLLALATAIGLGSRVFPATLMTGHPLWTRPLLKAPWWLIGVGLAAALIASGAGRGMTKRRRRALAAAHGWQFRESDPELPGTLPLDAGTGARAIRVVKGVRDGMPFAIFDYSNRGTVEIVYAVRALPFDLHPGSLGPYRVQGRWVMRAGVRRVSTRDLLRGLDEVRLFARQLITAAREQRLDELMRQWEAGKSARKP
ncbi:hypothetical protein QLQ12_24805 [Actinoplanes sp. NEAU-A12]|uniref:SRPBCC family protein n=1 Tax=Actinoplanes sandaracinus TaxID=3045177 RepID=A0ABT6WQ27_9ACTN|nr:hypothetical protein [Actinoplanes sandaracinus]MDI6101847.1 hypothetical protein [Actinoplanes sandaracinus]